MSFAPIVLFVYNRPWHTEQTLNALMQNELADRSTLFIYCDGPKAESTSQQLQEIDRVRKMITEKSWCKTVHIVEKNQNFGLQKSIIQGVSEIVNEHDKIIFLEDDIVTSPAFLNYMNAALDLYEKVSDVATINSWMHPISRMPPFFFRPVSDCWGWGTWKDRWQLLEQDSQKLYNILLADKHLLKQYDKDRLALLKASVQNDNKTNSWYVKWANSLYIHGKLNLYPGISYTRNIGLDGSGAHGSINIKQSSLNSQFDLNQLRSIKNKGFVSRVDSFRASTKIINYEISRQGFPLNRAIQKMVAHLL